LQRSVPPKARPGSPSISATRVGIDLGWYVNTQHPDHQNLSLDFVQRDHPSWPDATRGKPVALPDARRSPAGIHRSVESLRQVSEPPIPPPAREIGRSARGAFVATLIPVSDEETEAYEMRNVVWLIRGYATVSLLTLAAVVVFRHHASMVTPAVWVRGTIVAAASLLTLFLAVRAARGDRRMLLRLRIVTALMLTATVVIIALPGMFPLWFKLEQGICGLLLLPVVIQLNRRRAVRS
jgi:hypothetical protein